MTESLPVSVSKFRSSCFFISCHSCPWIVVDDKHSLEYSISDQSKSVNKECLDSLSAPGAGTAANVGGRRSSHNTTMGSDKWTKQREDNHVSVFYFALGNG